MKRVILFLLFTMATRQLAHGQLDFRCRLVNSRVLQFESIPVEVTIVNNTGEQLVLGRASPALILAFDVESAPGALIMPTGKPLLTNEVVIKRAETAQLTVDLLPSYQIRDTGPHSVVGRLEWRDKVFVSAKMYLDILPGLEIARITGGVPGADGVGRTYSLRTLNRGRMERAFLRITDDAGRCYGVLDLGRIVRMYKPVLQVDEDGHLQVLHQNGPNTFVRHVISFDGQAISQETYFGDGTGLRSQVRPQSEAPSARDTAGDENAGGETVDLETLFKESVAR